MMEELLNEPNNDHGRGENVVWDHLEWRMLSLRIYLLGVSVRIGVGKGGEWFNWRSHVHLRTKLAERAVESTAAKKYHLWSSKTESNLAPAPHAKPYGTWRNIRMSSDHRSGSLTKSVQKHAGRAKERVSSNFMNILKKFPHHTVKYTAKKMPLF